MQGRRADSRGHQNLPLLAPRSELEPLPSSTGGENPPSERKRSRLPPRSRSGCWICRTRKVKCDEERPECGQCQRTRHACDYSPRVVFKDDTPRIVDRMQEVSVEGSRIWDANVLERRNSVERSTIDDLPPFSTLTTDEERERKAELQEPGTYHVVANPSSFILLPQYRDETSSNQTPNTRMPAGKEQVEDDISNSGHSVSDLATIVTSDPNVVILKVFEEPVLKPMAQPATPTPVSPGSSQTSPNSEPQSFITHYPFRPTDGQSVSMLDIANDGGRDSELLQHYRSAISQHVLQFERSEEREDIFEVEARTYPPLFHAMMAFAALSIAHQNGIQSAVALEHYQKAIPALQTTVRSSQDSCSDGALLTHFILLLYEIAAAGHPESNMWQHHSRQLMRIVTLRRQMSGTQPPDYLVWMICCLDIYALLSSSGTGAFVEDLIKQNMLPAPERSIPPMVQNPDPVFYPDETPYFPGLLKLNHEILLVSLQAGQLARDLRAEAARRRSANQGQLIADQMYFIDRRTRVTNLHRLLERSRAAWRNDYYDYMSCLDGSSPVPRRVFGWIIHSYMLFRATIIYSLTSMFPGQLKDWDPGSDVELKTCTAEILATARRVIDEERFELRFIVLPLFMAGFATPDAEEKDSALSMLKAMERHSYGGSTGSVRRLLETIHEKQAASILRNGTASGVDFVEEMDLAGQKLILCGL